MRNKVAKRLRREAVAAATTSSKITTSPLRWITHGLSYPTGARDRRKHNSRRKRSHWGGNTSRYAAGSWRAIYRALKAAHARGGAA